MRNTGRAAPLVIRLMTLLAGAAAVAAWASPAHAEDKMVLGARQFENDTSGKGAVLCVWSIYLSIQAQTAACAR
jgi:hypothetical protein